MKANIVAAKTAVAPLVWKGPADMWTMYGVVKTWSWRRPASFFVKWWMKKV